ncbi:hypothetical protein QF028_001932 [Neobacillus sp. B4I6]|jgi:hypothetical protein
MYLIKHLWNGKLFLILYIKLKHDRWMDAAYFYMLSDFVVAVTLAEIDIAQAVADKWIAGHLLDYLKVRLDQHSCLLL